MQGTITISANEETGVTVEMMLKDPGYLEKQSVRDLLKALLDYVKEEENNG